MIELEVFGADTVPQAPGSAELEDLCATAAAHFQIEEGHVAIEFVDAARIAELNLEHRGKPQPTDVLSFPIDGAVGETGDATRADGVGVPRELGDIVICAEHTADLREAVVHGMLHLLGMDHETDRGEMLALQRQLLARG
ncbi:MAG: rRNA maturation RNase YbeY [Solirubrobacteraceae bacterium]